MIKSKKWYQNQIKCLENATERLGSSIRTTMEICHNDIAEGFKMTKSDRILLDSIYKQLNQLKDDYYLYYRR